MTLLPETSVSRNGVESIRYRILGPASVAFLFFFGLAIFAIYWLQKSHIENNIQSSLNRLQKIFNEEIREEAELLEGLLSFIEKDQGLQEAWLAKDRDKLFNLALPLFQDIHSKYRVTHFYFIGLDKVCFLRVHNPSRFGDTIERHTLGQVVMKKKPVHGVELGKFGTLTLRRVHPWWVDGKLIGYLEIGEEIEHITQELSDILNLELIFTIDKHRLKQSQWEEGLKMLNRTGDWDQFPDFVVIDSTTEKTFPALEEYMEDHESHVPHNSLGALGKLESFGSQGAWKGGIIPLIDARNHEIGHIISLQDITLEESSLRTLVITLIGLGGLIFAILVSVYSRYVGGIENSLISSRQGLIREIDERKKADKQLKLAQRRILASEKLSGIGRLAAGVSHEILNPLNIISIHTQILLESKKDDEAVQKSLGKIQNEIKRIEKINKSLLTFSRKGESQSRKINVTQEIETVLDLVEKDLSLDNIEVVRETSSGKFEVRADPDELRQVFLNILQNARHAMSSGGTLSLQVKNVKIDELDYAHIRLSDTGCGISKENLKNIFEPFFTTKPEGEGTGMGLSVCHTLIEKNGGAIHVESEEGKGTTFFIDLPLFEAEGGNDF